MMLILRSSWYCIRLFCEFIVKPLLAGLITFASMMFIIGLILYFRFSDEFFNVKDKILYVNNE